MAICRIRGAAWVIMAAPLFAACALIDRAPVAAPRDISSYRGVIHVHSDRSYDSVAPLSLIHETAARCGYDFVILNDHDRRASVAAINARQVRPLLMAGVEASTDHGHMLVIGGSTQPPPTTDSQRLIAWARNEGAFCVAAHPLDQRHPWTGWALPGVTGMELYNFTYGYYPVNKMTLLLRLMGLSSRQFLRASTSIPKSSFELWEERLAHGRYVAIGAADAHLKWQPLGLTPENFSLYLQSVSMYVDAEALTADAIVAALAAGRSFIAFEANGDASEVDFHASSDGNVARMGDVLHRETAPIRVHASVPAAARIELFAGKQQVARTEGRVLEHMLTQRPAYVRMVAYRDGRIWIVTNPIYFASASGGE